MPHPLATNPEFQQILRCLHSKPDPHLISANRCQSFLDICRKHAIRPLIHRSLASTAWEGVPDQVRTSLEQFTLRNTRRNAILTFELVRIVTLLKSEGVRSITFKGPVLAENLYGSLSLREFLDVDIVVNKVDKDRAEALLTSAGYSKAGTGTDREYLAQSGQTSFRQPGTGFGIDLHWKLAPFGVPLPFSEAELWEESQELPLAATKVPTLSWDHLALFLAFHGTKERWRSLKWICDFAELTRKRPELDWESLRHKAARHHCSRSLLVAAHLCHSVGLAVPPVLLAAGQKDPAVEALACRTLVKLAHPRPETDLSVAVDAVASAERYRDKASLCFALLTTLTVSDFRLIRLHPRLRGLYYVIRPFRIAAKAAALLFQTYRPRAAR